MPKGTHLWSARVSVGMSIGGSTCKKWVHYYRAEWYTTCVVTLCVWNLHT
jgi:hypothetical protein